MRAASCAAPATAAAGGPSSSGGGRLPLQPQPQLQHCGRPAPRLLRAAPPPHLRSPPLARGARLLARAGLDGDGARACLPPPAACRRAAGRPAPGRAPPLTPRRLAPRTPCPRRRRRADLAGLKADLERFRKNESAAQAAAPKQARQPSG